MKVPAFMLKKLYVSGSLTNAEGGARFRMKNTMASATLIAAPRISVDGNTIEPKELLFQADGEERTADEITPENPIEFKKGVEVEVIMQGHTLTPGKHLLKIESDTKEWQTLAFDVEDTVA